METRWSERNSFGRTHNEGVLKKGNFKMMILNHLFGQIAAEYKKINEQRLGVNI